MFCSVLFCSVLKTPSIWTGKSIWSFTCKPRLTTHYCLLESSILMLVSIFCFVNMPKYQNGTVSRWYLSIVQAGNTAYTADSHPNSIKLSHRNTNDDNWYKTHTHKRITVTRKKEYRKDGNIASKRSDTNVTSSAKKDLIAEEIS